MESGKGEMSSNTADASDLEFNVNVDTDADAELEQMQQHLKSLEEELQLKSLQESAARDEGVRKTATPAHEAASKSGTSIFVKGLDPRTTEADLRVFFSSCGAISRVTVLKGYNGAPKGIAYVEFETEDQAHAGILKDGQSLHGKPLKIAPKRDNVPGFHRGSHRFSPMERGGMNSSPQVVAAMAMLANMMGGGSNHHIPRGRGRGRGRGGY